MAKTCNNCTTEKTKTTENTMVPYAVVELAEARQKWLFKRMWIALIVAVALMFLTNMMWVGVFSSYDYSSEEVIIEADQDGEGANIVGGGNVDYGPESANNNPQEKTD